MKVLTLNSSLRSGQEHYGKHGIGSRCETELDEIQEYSGESGDVRNYSYTVVDDPVYYRVNSLIRSGENACRHCKTCERHGCNRDTVRELIAMQMEEFVADEEIQKL